MIEGCSIYTRRFQKLWQDKTTRVVVAVLAAAFVVITFQSSADIFRAGEATDPSSLSPLDSGLGLRDGAGMLHPVAPPTAAGGGSLVDGSSNRTGATEPARAGEAGPGDGGAPGDEDVDVGDEEDGEEDDTQDDFFFDLGDGTVLRKAKDGHIVVEKVGGRRGNKTSPGVAVPEKLFNHTGLRPELRNSSLPENRTTTSLVSSLAPPPPQTAQSSGPPSPNADAATSSSAPPAATAATVPPQQPVVVKKKKKKKKKERFTGVWSIADMDRELLRSRASPETMIPLWPSPLDEQLMYAKHQIENAPIVTNDPELYAPLYRNVSMFKRSYELMEQILKVYVYKEGERPIFHTPFYTGIYASEGWFMKHMQQNTQFVVSDPGKAHLFYMPFSSRTLQSSLYVADSHSHTNLIDHLRSYVRTIASRYPFWNRTGGADHFFAACHDWAPHETERSMPATIRALCNADVREGFELGKDVSLPETYVRYKDDPLRGLGGKSGRKRTTLAFFAGNMHGYLRPILLQHWENKDPRMKIFGPMPKYGAVTIRKKNRRKKMNMYLEYMKDSKYCICPRGYEVNSPRVIEAIFYECVPVIISDNFVPPLFEVLNWDAFSVILPERDIPRLKEILESIPEKRYLRLLMGVKRVQRHFLWNKTPARYDLFHMVLHSVWFNRVHQLRTV